MPQFIFDPRKAEADAGRIDRTKAEVVGCAYYTLIPAECAKACCRLPADDMPNITWMTGLSARTTEPNRQRHVHYQHH
jgi:hypothetical protein